MSASVPQCLDLVSLTYFMSFTGKKLWHCFILSQCAHHHHLNKLTESIVSVLRGEK